MKHHHNRWDENDGLQHLTVTELHKKELKNPLPPGNSSHYENTIRKAQGTKLTNGDTDKSKDK